MKIEVQLVEPVPEDRRPRLGLATVLLDLGGVPFRLGGVRLVQNQWPGQPVLVRAPCHRTMAGNWSPSLVLPRNIQEAIEQAVLTEARARGLVA